MSMQVLKISERNEVHSKGEMMLLRKEGKVPGNIFGKGRESQKVFVDRIEFEKAIHAGGKILELDLNGKKTMVNTKAVQRDHLGKYLFHVDFHELQKGVETTVRVPVHLEGKAAGEKEGGSVQQRLTHIELTGTPSKIPEDIKVDVSALNVGESLHISDIKDKISLKINTDEALTIAACVAPKKQEETVVEAAAETAPAAEATAPETEASNTENKE